MSYPASGSSELCSQTICQGGSFALESVAAFVWNGWQACAGISGRLGVEYAINYGSYSIEHFIDNSQCKTR